jgi:hypothetical protein
MSISSLLFVIIWSILQVGQTQQYDCTGFVTPSTSPYVSFFRQSLTNVPWSDCQALCKAFHPNAYLMRPNDSYQLYYVHQQWGGGDPWVDLLKNNNSQWVWGDGSLQTLRFNSNSNDTNVGWCAFKPGSTGNCGVTAWCGDNYRAGLGDYNCNWNNSCACQLTNRKLFNISSSYLYFFSFILYTLIVSCWCLHLQQYLHRMSTCPL